MNLVEFKDLIVSADSDAKRYEGCGKENYTVWSEYKVIHLVADDTVENQGWKVQVDRFTKVENDPVADAITAILIGNDIEFEQLVDYEQDTGYIHHIWDCVVI